MFINVCVFQVHSIVQMLKMNIFLQIGSMAEIVYPHGCRPITDDLGPDELVRRLKARYLVIYFFYSKVSNVIAVILVLQLSIRDGNHF